MKLPALLVVAALLVLKTSAASVSDVVAFTLPGNWKTAPLEQSSPFPTEKFSPTDGRNATLLVTLLPMSLVKVSDETSLKALYLQLWSGTVGASAGTPQITELKVANGTGYYATNEDPTLVGKPPKKNDFKFGTPIVLWLRPDILIQATLLTDSATGSDFTEGLQIIKSVKAVGHPSPVTPELRDKLARPPIQIRGPDAVLMIPMSTFKPTGTGDKARHYFAFIDEKGINLSGWMDEAAHYSNFREFWAHEKSAMEKGTGLKVSDEEVKIIAGWSAVLYTIKMGDLVQRNLRACRVTGNTWADLHMSVVASMGSGTDLEEMLKTFILKRD